MNGRENPFSLAKKLVLWMPEVKGSQGIEDQPVPRHEMVMACPESGRAGWLVPAGKKDQDEWQKLNQKRDQRIPQKSIVAGSPQKDLCRF